MPSLVLKVHGTRLLLDEQPFCLQGLGFFNAIFNPAFNASTEARLVWLNKFKANGINLLRIWCQWDYARPYIDLAPDHAVFDPDGGLRDEYMRTLCAIIEAAAGLGMAVEVVLFCQEQRHNLAVSAQKQAVCNVTTRLRPYRNTILQIWNEKSFEVAQYLDAIKSIDPERIVTNSPGGSNILGDDSHNKLLDVLTPHTVRGQADRFWEIAPQQVAALIAQYHKPVIDDEPARTGLIQFGGIADGTQPEQHIEQIRRVRAVDGYHIYHHDMFQNGYGHPATPPHGIPDPDFSPFHRRVFDYLRDHTEW